MIQYTKIFALIFSIGLIILSGCEPNKEIYEEFDNAEVGPQNNIEITLSDSDYGTIASMATESDPGDTINAAFIDANGYFTDSIAAANYIPALLDNNYPAFAPGSKAQVTFNYHGDMPEDFAYYSEPDSYVLSDDDYASVNFEVGLAKYFYPSSPAQLYLPMILDSVIYEPYPGDILLVSYEKSDVDPVIDTTSSQAEPIFTEKFTLEEDSLGTFIDENVTGDQIWQWADFDGGCVAMTGYFEGNQYENENWLITPSVEIGNEHEEVTLNFRHAINYLYDQWEQLDVLITSDYNEDNPLESQWVSLQIPNWTSGNSWTFESSEDIDLSNYIGTSIRVAFKYTSSTENACTWEISDVNINVPGNAAITGEDPYTTKTLYEFTENGWQIDENAYYLNGYDYDQMGAPGNYNNFSSDAKPANYIPTLLDYKYPLAGAGVSKIIVYDYYTGENTVALASEYTKEQNGQWTSAYDYVQQKTQQFLVGNSRGKWVFDPTVRFTMMTADYQIIVDFVIESDTLGLAYVDQEYMDKDFYFGSDAYHQDFSMYYEDRIEYDPSLEDLSEEDADKVMIKRMKQALIIMLERKFPDAVPEVSGIDVHYIVTFDTWDLARSTWEADFLCTQAASGDGYASFELVDNTLYKEGEAILVE